MFHFWSFFHFFSLFCLAERVKKFYRLLGVPTLADTREIKKAYRRLALKLHPDKTSGGSEAEIEAATAKFREVTNAYEVLSDEVKRRDYDARGSFSSEQGFDFSARNAEDMFRDFFGRDFVRETWSRH